MTLVRKLRVHPCSKSLLEVESKECFHLVGVACARNCGGMRKPRLSKGGLLRCTAAALGWGTQASNQAGVTVSKQSVPSRPLHRCSASHAHERSPSCLGLPLAQPGQLLVMH